MNNDFVALYVGYKLGKSLIPMGIFFSTIFLSVHFFNKFNDWANENSLTLALIALANWLVMPIIFLILKKTPYGAYFFALLLVVTGASATIVTVVACIYNFM